MDAANNDNAKSYYDAIALKQKIMDKGIYDFIILPEKEQRNLIINLGYAESAIYNEYNNLYKQFDINNFLKLINIYIVKNDPHIYLTTSEDNKIFDNLNELIVTKKDKSIIKGMKILYKGKIYDFSLY